MTTVDVQDEAAFLFTHRCTCCDDPIALRHEIICESIIVVDAFVNERDVEGMFTTMYCPACLVDVLELAGTKNESQIGALLDF